MDRLWAITLLLGLALFALWYFGEAVTTYYRPELDFFFLFAAIYTTGLGLFALLARHMGYVRAFDSYLLVASPFFRFKTSYRRIRGISCTDFHRLYDLSDLSWTEERYVEPLIASTAVVVTLSDYPISPGVMGYFFTKYLVSPKDRALVFVVPDWMALSVELDSRYNEYRQRQRSRKQRRGFQRGLSP